MAKKTTKKTSVPSVPKKKISVPSVPLNQALMEACSSATKNSKYLDYNTKVRSMSIQCYCPPERWGALLKEAYRYAYIYHDKDVNDDGTLKTPHYHIVVRFSSPRYRSAVEKMFDLEGLTEDTTVNFQKVKSLGSVFAYLTHRSASSVHKYQYDENAVVSNDISYFTTIAERVSSEADMDIGDYSLNTTFLEDLTADDFSLYKMCLRYGRDYMKNYRIYQMLRYDLINAEEQAKEDEIRRVETIELASTIESADNGFVIDDADVIGKYIADNIIKNKACDYGTASRQLENFLVDIRKAVAKYIDMESIR